ncbi:MAG: hypothetical protein RLZZ336_1679 [Cyanobacteriota bacterium]
MFSWFNQAGAGVSSGGRVLDVEVLERSVVDEQVLWRLLRRAGRVLAQPALECLELLLDADTPPQVKLTVMAALTYLLMPMDLLPDLLPGVGFSDDLVAMTTLLGTCWRHRTPEIRQRAQRRLDHWFPLAP